MNFIKQDACILVASTVRDCESTLENTIANVDKAFGSVRKIEYFFVESDSIDNTKDLLDDLSEKRTNIKYLSLGFLQKKSQKELKG